MSARLIAVLKGKQRTGCVGFKKGTEEYRQASIARAELILQGKNVDTAPEELATIASHAVLHPPAWSQLAAKKPKKQLVVFADDFWKARELTDRIKSRTVDLCARPLYENDGWTPFLWRYGTWILGEPPPLREFDWDGLEAGLRDDIKSVALVVPRLDEHSLPRAEEHLTNCRVLIRAAMLLYFTMRREAPPLHDFAALSQVDIVEVDAIARFPHLVPWLQLCVDRAVTE